MNRWKRQRLLFLWPLAVALLGLGYGETLGGATSQGSKPVPPQKVPRYTVSLQAPEAVFQYQATEVSVHVQTLQGEPLDGISVEFLLHPVSRRYAVLLPGRTRTRGGHARAMLRANQVGMVRLTARVGALRKHADIMVVMPVASPPRPAPEWRDLTLAQLFFAGH